jgi:cob(I)alamin adenosyltransferase
MTCTMGHRLSKIYTRTGDAGMTGLADGQRVSKTDPRIEAVGAIDELNSALGLVLAEAIGDPRIRATLTRVQDELFDAGAELSLPGHSAISARMVGALEADLDAVNDHLPPLREFILPGGSRAAATCHLARAIARRAERRAWTLATDGGVAETLLHYLNRLSDYLFVAARSLARENGGAEVFWQRQARAERE